MIETVVVIGIFATTLGSVAALYYKLGKLETKVNFIYNNINTVVRFKNDRNEMEVERNENRNG
jgi:hypothetical protein